MPANRMAGVNFAPAATLLSSLTSATKSARRRRSASQHKLRWSSCRPSLFWRRIVLSRLFLEALHYAAHPPTHCGDLADRSRSDHLYRHRVDRVVAVAQTIPLGALRLSPTGGVGGARPDSDRARMLKTRDQLPPLPSPAPPFADQARFAPRPPIQAYIKPRYASPPPPGHPPEHRLLPPQEARLP